MTILQPFAYTTGSTSLHFTYDELGPMSVTYDGAEYFYLKNAQGDVTGLVNSGGAQVVAYTYDAWGNPLTTTGTMADTLGKLNPFRYRGYFYDTETGLYYLQSRYYDPGVGRFINADNAIASVSGDIRGYNLFCYCMNNPVNMSDCSGHWPQWIKNAARKVVNAVKKTVAAIVNTVKSAVSFAKRSPSSSLPTKGEPGSSKTLPNPDGTPKQKR